ncbi:MAG: gamma-glutamyl-gamma-aminobutyrate hydrolase family protein, partial [Thermodesulfovibrionales bacterium]
MQLVNVAMGGSLFQDIARQCGSGLDHTKGFHLVRIGEGAFVASGTYRVNSSHHQAVRRLGEGVNPLAYSEDGILEALEVRGPRFCIGVQWHPERDMSSVPNMRLFQQFREACCGA